VQEALILDDKGQPIMENGQYKIHESLPYIMNQIHENQSAYALAEFKKSGTLTPQMTGMVSAVADHFLQKAKLSGDERLEAAAEIFKGAIAPQPSASEEIPEHLKVTPRLTHGEREGPSREGAGCRSPTAGV
jgi:NADH dehydrogenase FAD-containing subunit